MENTWIPKPTPVGEGTSKGETSVEISEEEQTTVKRYGKEKVVKVDKSHFKCTNGFGPLGFSKEPREVQDKVP